MALLSAMYAATKVAEARGVSLWELLWARQVFALPIIAGLVAAGPGFASVRTTRMKSHAVRSAMGMFGVVLNFSSVAMLPLAEATTLSFTVPMFGTLLAAMVLKERVGIHRWGAVVVGFIGVLIVTQPGSGHLPVLGASIGIAAALSVAGTSLMIRDLGRTEVPLTTVFWFTSISAVTMSLAAPFVLHRHDPGDWAIMVLVGVTGGLAQVAVTSSLRHAPVSTVLPMDYSALIWASLLGWLLFGALPGQSTWLGAPVIVASGLYIVWRERVRHRLIAIAAGRDE
ncbi:EamA domain-containing protein [Sphingomonas antarctica]